MANKPLLTGVRELKIGKTFTKGYKDEAYHTIRYDFKPASVDSQNVGSMEVVDKEVTLNIPLTGGAGSASQAVFKGNKTPASKDCLLIIDHITGEVVLERINQNIRVKKTRIEGTSRRALPKGGRMGQDLGANKPSPSQNHPSSSPHVPRPPSPPRRSPNRGSSSAKPHANTLDAGSMPMLNFEEEQKTGSIMSDSSSDSDSNSCSSSSDSDSDSDNEAPPPTTQNATQSYNTANGHSNVPRNGAPNNHKSPSVLSDLELSEED